MRFPNREVQITTFSIAEELSGKMQFSGVDEKLMHAVIDNDQDIIKEGKMIEIAGLMEKEFKEEDLEEKKKQ